MYPIYSSDYISVEINLEIKIFFLQLKISLVPSTQIEI